MCRREQELGFTALHIDKRWSQSTGWDHKYGDVLMVSLHCALGFLHLFNNFNCYCKSISLNLTAMLTLFSLFSSLFTVVLFCMAALIFPIGFYINEVGGQPYKLPNNTVVGSSYVLFVLSIFFTIVGLLFAGKVCLPGWRTPLHYFECLEKHSWRQTSWGLSLLPCWKYWSTMKLSSTCLWSSRCS